MWKSLFRGEAAGSFGMLLGGTPLPAVVMEHGRTGQGNPQAKGVATLLCHGHCLVAPRRLDEPFPELPCRPPWHFWGWFGIAEAHRMQQYVARYGLRMRLGQTQVACDIPGGVWGGGCLLGRVCHCGPSQQRIDVWHGEGDAWDVDAFWRAVEASYCCAISSK
jgi:hypothetical protein